MRIFLTGGTGFIGSHVLKQALAAGHQVLALRRRKSEPRIRLEQQPQWCEGALTDDWSEALAGCDAFLHLAAYGVAAGAYDWDGCFQTNVIDSLQLWRKAATAGIRRFLIVGSCFEYGRSGERYEVIPPSAPLEPTTAYGASKAAASMAALALAVDKQLQLILARPFHVYGEGEAPERFWPMLVAAALSGDDLPMTSGDQIRDFQPVEQAAKQLLSWLESSEIRPGKPQVVNLGTSEYRSLLSFAQQEWLRLHASGELKPGAIPQRHNEVLRYVPQVSTPNIQH
ncbi:NAD(P)-dependent oxidoreductase [Synechococcus sp. CBW1006]|uniref:NAD-dependent epimerase/dehydratase family protein n=1 Tax=Synechococcus sp. CBW1006 TaxID=1353138 RepID=UPI0018CD634B|nr:NAD-dependent epimerase/dehydratase family protein [Synechococcus sp. CBW1006]QPN65842.1 NAD-dependent epimerase/dehydratase family protein [Synechococcus sp. CBW1006]